jgi:MoaA/NifB/PqqE/SkfB family radical SAM enzyme
MLTEEAHAAGVASRADDHGEKIVSHEEAAHEKRNWVRLTFDCNDHCIFCLDSNAHDGTVRDRDEVKKQILDGRRAGATRLILSGGEPTIHPSYVDFIKLGALAGYRKIQTVTNGRMFSYPQFLQRCLDAGLSEITFSLHGPNAKVHDALVGTKGAFDEEIAALRAALEDGRPIVNVDVVVNRANVKHLPEMLEKLTAMGVGEFDLLQVVPFGRAFTDGRDTLFYDLEEARPWLLEAFAYSKRPDVHIWLNRFPPQHLEGYEHLIQDPYKLTDEVRGRKEEFARRLDEDVALDCREPARCKYCYLERLCDTLEGVVDTMRAKTFEIVRVDTEWQAQQPPVFGGDPASLKRVRLPMVDDAAKANAPRAVTLDALVPNAKRLWIKAPDVARAAQALGRHPPLKEIELELERYDGLEEALREDGAWAGRRLVRAVTASRAEAEALLAMDADFEVVVMLTKETAPWLLSFSKVPARVVVRQPTYERLTENAANDVDLHAFFAAFAREVPVENVPACVSGRAPRARPVVLDAAMMDESGRLEIFRYTRRYILEHYATKSLRCKSCVHASSCDGTHVNFVRAHGYGVMTPVAP